MEKYIITLILISLSLSAVSQDFVSFQTDFGYFSKINYKSAIVTERNNIRTHLAVNYTRFIKPNLAIETGLGLSNYSNTVVLASNYKATSNEVDSFGSGFEFGVMADNYEEQQKILLATIPLRLRFEDSLTANGVIFYSSIGVKYMLPIYQKFNALVNSITTTGYYPNNKLLIENVPTHGFTTKEDVKATVDSSYKPSFSLTAELGVKLQIEKKYAFYVGGFLDYGLTDVRKDANTNDNVIVYVDGDTPTESNGISTLKGVDNVRLVSFGLQLRFPLYTIK